MIKHLIIRAICRVIHLFVQMGNVAEKVEYWFDNLDQPETYED